MAESKKREVWWPPEWTDDDVRAVQSIALFAQGAEKPWEPGHEPPVPTPLDCKRALDFIIHKACSTYENSFIANDPNGRIGAFQEGRRFAGQQLIKIMKIKLGLAKRDPYSEEG